ncbi:GNAT family N-acetyltransferase [Lipingzhangella sp. LS1_29]|uniref:GNAT family N-acetyltransferase n=1 Tax=Lipingzhangella rawalii TaxID=2055835 RepID=A0ABU2H0R2_9ACTN|nr:GNAT family N-acetyltransferase [Lipingzhangella rawalii]MDS1268886.1 GNAT family N-acetyltransferase [Lipingzhangella rawalii]
MLVRCARPHELPAAGDLRVTTYVGQGLVDPDSPYIPTLRSLGEDGEGQVLVAVDEDDILGTATLMGYRPDSEVARTPDEVELRALAVSPRAQGHGIGRLLLEAVLRRAEAAAARAIVLSTQSNMVTAQRMYQKAGFVRAPERDWTPGRGIQLLAYRLPLSSSFSNRAR